MNNVVAQEVDPSRVSLPEQAGVVDPRRYLSSDQAKIFDNLESIIKPPSEWPSKLPRACHMISRENEACLRLRLLTAGMAELMLEDDVPCDSAGRKLLAGLFCVGHKKNKLRLIIDRRPQNSTENRLCWETLPHGSLLSQVFISPDQHLRGSGDDLSNYFYLLSHAPNWTHRNCFGRVFTGESAVALGGDPTKRYHLKLTVLGMGDLNSVDIAQATHLGILRGCGCMAPEHSLVYGQPVPESDVLEGVYVDDHLILGRVPKHLVDSDTGPDMKLLEASRVGYDVANAPVSSEKSFTRLKNFVAWGTEVRSEAGTAGAPRERRLQLMVLTMLVLLVPGVNRVLMRSLLGSYVHPFSHSKQLMCLFGRVYKWANGLHDKKLVPLPPDIREELLIAALHLPLAQANLRAPVSTNVTCSDATLTTAGIVEALVSRDMSDALYSHCEHKGAYTRLDWTSLDWKLQKWDQTRLPDVLRDAVRCTDWKCCRSYDFSSAHHVNIQEARAMLTAIDCHAAHQSGPIRCLNGTDSRVVLGAWAKGRSSSCHLNHVFRRALGRCALHQLVLAQFWLETALNPADDPSRYKPVREPARAQGVVASLVLPESTRSGSSTHGPRRSGKVALEVFSGVGRLTQCLRSVDFECDEPLEAYPGDKVYIPLHDLDRAPVVSRLLKLIYKGKYYYIHFGMPCSSFSLLQNLNKGTRTSLRPEGDGSLDRERLGNRLADAVCLLCRAQHEIGGYFSIENPRSSFLWKYAPVRDLFQFCGSVSFDQCMYGLVPPNLMFPPKPTATSNSTSTVRQPHSNSSVCERIKKPTLLLTNLKALDVLERRCDKSHQHVACMGSVKTALGWRSVAKEAGAYPLSLCKPWAAAVARSCRDQERRRSKTVMTVESSK